MDEHLGIKQLENGIVLAHRRVYGTKIVHCSVMFDIGSRDEKDHEVGLAHLWEHMAFKGTEKRSAYQVLTYLDALGGELNAFTTKEKICFHASILDVHFEKAIDILADIAFFSVFPEKELEKEKRVVLEEISMYHDTPDDAIQDEFEAVLFDHHPMGNNILGTTESILSFTRGHFQEFIKNNMATDRVVFATTGDLSTPDAFKRITQKLSRIERKSLSSQREPVKAFKPISVSKEKAIQQAHCMIGGRALSLYHPDKYKFMLLNNILGGPASNSMLNLSLREKHGYVYSVESNYNAFTDTGAFQVYFATEKKQVGRCLDLVRKEVVRLDEVVGKKSKLQAFKEQIKGQLAIAEENNQSYMLMMSRSLLDLGKMEELETIFAEIDSTTSDQLIAIRQEYLNPDRLSVLTFLPS